MGDFSQGGEWLLNKAHFFFYGETNISLKTRAETAQTMAYSEILRI